MSQSLQSLVSVTVFLALLACLPLLVKWLKQRSIVPGARESSGQSRFISALAVGPHQRVVTVEVGPDGNRVWLTLGITAQHISCLHSAPVHSSPDNGQKPVAQQALVQP